MALIDNRKLKETRKLPCFVCGSGMWNSEKGEWRNNAHHIKSKGMGSGKRDDSNVVSMCPVCHDLLHNYSKTFIDRYGQNKYNKLRGIL